MTSVSDLISVPPVKTVIKFSDLLDEDLKKLLYESFILTGEVTENLTVILREISRKKGQGFFLQGSYGTGKSHFLGILSLLLSEPLSHGLLRFSGELSELSIKITDEKFFVLNLSLLEHSSSESLEDIISFSLDSHIKKLTGKSILSDMKRFKDDIISLLTARYRTDLEIFLSEKGFSETDVRSDEVELSLLEELIGKLDLPYRFKYSRKDFFTDFMKIISSSGYTGAVFLIDELSEFLRSKPTGRKFNEDIRFLQFLGEISSSLPLWITGSLQERIEETGEISPYVFNKIKDRYPVRLFLTGKHIEELIKGRLIIKRDGAIDRLKTLYKKFKGAFSSWSVTEERFVSLYPVHPETVFLLDNLKFLFSQQRGVVDFIHYEIKGDDTRNIEGILQWADDTLLTPDLIFDHFRVRIKETIELNIYHDIVYKYYEHEMDKLFPSDEERLLAFRLIKILIISAILPIKKHYSVKNMAEIILYRVTDIESGINYQYISDILERLCRDGAYIGVIKHKEPFEYAYFIDMEADINLIIKRKTEYIENSLFPEDSRIYEQLFPWFTDPLFPLAHFRLHSLTRRSVTWQNTARDTGLVITSLTRFTGEKISLLSEQMAKSEMDFVFFIATPSEIDKQVKYLEDIIVPLIEDKKSYVFWIPEKIIDERPFREAFSHMMLWEEYKEDSSATGKRAVELLSSLLDKERKKVFSLLTESYKSGRFIFFPCDIKYSVINELFSFDNILEQVSSSVLEYIYPKHIDISPFMPALTRNKIKDLIDRFLRPGRMIIDRNPDYGLRMIIEGFLQPMKLVRKIPGGFELSVSPRKSEITSLFLSLMFEEKNLLEDIYWQMRKGLFGISSLQFELLVYSLVFSGLITPVNEDRKIGLNQISGSNFEKITHILPGELIPSSLQEKIRSLTFLPQKYQKEDFTYGNQQEIWNILCQKKREMEEDIDKLSGEINKICNYQGLKDFDWICIRKDIETVRSVLEEIKISYSSLEGLERLSLCLQESPHIVKTFEKFDHIKNFFFKHVDKYLFIYHYINYPGFSIPEHKDYLLITEEKKRVSEILSDTNVFTPDYMKELEESFERFVTMYQSVYQKEHMTVLSEERFLVFDRIKDTEGYRLLKHFSKISFLSVKDDRVKVDRYIARIMEQKCRYFEPGLLRRKPVCTCGFLPGNEVSLPSLHEVEGIIERGIKEYLTALREERYRENLFYVIKGLEEIGENKIASSLRQLLQIDLDDITLLSHLRECVNPPVIDAVNEALCGRFIIVTRNIDDLYDNLLDRSFPGDKITEIFQEWVTGGEVLDSKIYVKVISKTSSHRELPLKLEIHERYPELSYLYQKMGEEKFNVLLWVLLWFSFHSIDYKKNVSPLTGISFHDIEKDYDTIIEFGKYIFFEKKDLAAALIKDAEGIIFQEKLEVTLWNTVTENSAEDKLSVTLNTIKKEEVFPFIREKAYYLLFKLLHDKPSLVNRQELSDFYNSTDMNKGDKERAFKLFFSINKSIDALDKYHCDRLNNYLQWEKVFSLYLSFLHYWLSSFNKSVKSAVEDIFLYQLKDRIDGIFKLYNDEFINFYSMSYDKWKKGEKPRPYFIHDIVSDILPMYSNSLRPEHIEYLLLDGLRWDLWGYIKKKRFPCFSQCRIVREIPLWAHAPSVTSVQLEAFRLSDWPPVASLDRFSFDELHFEEESNLHEERKQTGTVENFTKYNLIDNKIHNSCEDLHVLYQEIDIQLGVYLESYMKSLPQKTMVILFSDHGFREIIQSGKNRYVHGSISPEEIIVPLVVIFKS
ncbi:MAG: DUF6079 family protein [Candidatus Eremiobacterota bacterium]